MALPRCTDSVTAVPEVTYVELTPTLTPGAALGNTRVSGRVSHVRVPHGVLKLTECCTGDELVIGAVTRP